MKTKALFTFHFSEDEIKNLEELGFEIILRREKDLKYTKELEDVEFMFTYNPFKHFDIAKLKKLKWIQLESDGFEQIPKEYTKNNGIIVTNNKNGYSVPISEWIVWSILSTYKEANIFFQNKQDKKWKLRTSLREIFGETVGILGTGHIAIETAKRLQAFGVNVLGLNTTGRKVEYFNECYAKDRVEEMIKECDVVVSLLPITDETHHFINERIFLLMKNGVVFVNASRGKVVEEEKLIKFLKNGKIRAAALDVVEEEPLSKDSPLWQMNNVIITPHNSWISQNMAKRKYKLVYENMRRYKAGEQLKNIVDLQKGY
ncbi:phosphoglycerate dehydrogenase-like enzyme [Clostridium acetobutylicum]|uniref:Phosphoglycerate dehydrogenase n=1 Tax=Clostridium acetobutylicum (strain ATCC 824 / DSM 792 / JCM 1419 / IAM 19013 / LMG 5710 / NBRC 13948 / NRRL B-527 / VKM B-1787 / 2291 / W) TaxID=272562 RepID=Q97M35_CLOAB|nr:MULTISPECIES: phosphoglycerate dehydrogenase [Clostridium]AAK78345.1 Phosphoglycerate dehydrogenase [Clostridium acetobutylicum ATCC 824]ADZ19414.1 Phosphoglycerate dehydrogenase [Clostridium acetobutylicum EA 2018]AEI31200.1 phosphoglycerate dehydrogenase [Clostridium acetobutylicum DSM 1731]AWV80070.1 dihydrofolate reductase [Clostridium acetobutylicum]MBC2395891.1 dihydrofolate reductase [Clostridium acetobutylicum]